MDENVGGVVMKPLLDNLGRGRGDAGEWKTRTRTQIRACYICRQAKIWSKPPLNPLLTDALGRLQDTGHPQATATPRGLKFRSLLKTPPSTSISFLAHGMGDYL